MPASALEDTLTVKIKVGDDAEEFRFKIPSPRDIARINTRADVLRRRDDPESTSESQDGYTWTLYRGFALLEVLPFKADAKDNWPWTESKDAPGTLIVDSNNFPPGTELKVLEIWRGFSEELGRFHESRAGSRRAAASEAVAG